MQVPVSIANGNEGRKLAGSHPAWAIGRLSNDRIFLDGRQQWSSPARNPPAQNNRTPGRGPAP